tara:strand:+ start:867 stop:2204 length:1338 start_codon:yes stop_codon:yes gene_type:complete
MIGFETIGNATITIFDDKPVLTTDPWISGKPYFGSWTHAYDIPKNQMNNIINSKYVWFSHGHPDHLDPDSLEYFKDKTILISDHYGNRIFNELKKKYKCIKLENNIWFEISKNVRIKSFADWNQDSCLLIEINKKDIILNLNDGSALGWSREIKKIIKNYKNKFLLKLINWGDADMINFYNHHNDFILPLAAEKKPCGVSYEYYMKKWHCNFAIPFSSMHKYFREDSLNMNKFTTPLKKHYEGFNNKEGEMLPAFIIWDTIKEKYTEINPSTNSDIAKSASDFGDNWNDDLDEEDKSLIKNYFNKFSHIKEKFGLFSFKIGKSELNLKFSGKKEAIEFNTPRNSLVFAVKHNIFDDLLIGNFMKIKLINVPSLYPDFTPYVTKYGDNGLSYSKEELEKYFDYYKFNSANYWLDYLKIKSENIIRPRLEKYKSAYYLARKIKRGLF